jgi:hypothetical protein
VLLAAVVGCSTSGSEDPAVTTTTAIEVDGSAYERLVLTDTSDVRSCDEAAGSSDPAELIAAFNVARLRGRGAEDCLSEELAARYDDAACDYPLDLERDPGPTLLYGCGSHRVVAIPDDFVEAVKVDHNQVQQRVFVDGRRGQPEHLYIERTGTGDQRRQVITDASPI